MKNNTKLIIAGIVLLIILMGFWAYNADAFTGEYLPDRFPSNSSSSVGSQMTDLEMCNSGMVFQHRDEDWCNHYKLLDVLKKLLVVLER